MPPHLRLFSRIHSPGATSKCLRYRQSHQILSREWRRGRGHSPNLWASWTHRPRAWSRRRRTRSRAGGTAVPHTTCGDFAGPHLAACEPVAAERPVAGRLGFDSVHQRPSSSTVAPGESSCGGGGARSCAFSWRAESPRLARRAAAFKSGSRSCRVRARRRRQRERRCRHRFRCRNRVRAALTNPQGKSTPAANGERSRRNVPERVVNIVK